MRKLLLIASLTFLVTASGFADEQPGSALKIKEVPEQSILAIQYNGEGPLAPYFGKLVSYYNKPNTPFQVKFPQMTIEFSHDNQLVAIAFSGEATESEDVKIEKLPQVTVASMLHKGSYQSIGETVRKAYGRLQKLSYFPDGQPLRLLYWNSPDDQYPEDLLTEIQIPITLP